MKELSKLRSALEQVVGEIKDLENALEVPRPDRVLAICPQCGYHGTDDYTVHPSEWRCPQCKHRGLGVLKPGATCPYCRRAKMRRNLAMPDGRYECPDCQSWMVVDLAEDVAPLAPAEWQIGDVLQWIDEKVRLVCTTPDSNGRFVCLSDRKTFQVVDQKELVFSSRGDLELGQWCEATAFPDTAECVAGIRNGSVYSGQRRTYTRRGLKPLTLPRSMTA
jgi:hypothetical protein